MKRINRPILYMILIFVFVIHRACAKKNRATVGDLSTAGKVHVYYKTQWSDVKIHYSKDIDGTSWTDNNGVLMSQSTDDDNYPAKEGWWFADVSSNELEFVFNNNGQEWWDSNRGLNYKLNAPGVYVVENEKLTMVKELIDTVEIFYKSQWPSTKIHYSRNSSPNWTPNKGVVMSPSNLDDFPSSKGWVQYSVVANEMEFVFNNDMILLWDNNGDRNYVVSEPGLYAIADRKVERVRTYPRKCYSIENTLVDSPGYRVTEVVHEKRGMHLYLSLINSTAQSRPRNALISNLSMRVQEESSGIIHVKILDRDHPRYEVPEAILPRKRFYREAASDFPATFALEYESDPFSFQIIRLVDRVVVFDSSAAPLVVLDQYLQIATSVPRGSRIYGVGEVSASTLAMETCTTRTLWTRDTPAAQVNQNLYGSHPFYLSTNAEGRAHGALLLNSNGMDISLTEDKLIYQTLGGILDFYFFLGPTSKNVLTQYTQLIGRPAMMPYWSFGFHQCRFGYQSVWEQREVVANYTKAQIPLDTIWTDIEYMDKFKDFTFDPKHFPKNEMRKFVKELHSRGQKWVPIVDPALKRDDNYPTYQRGLQYNVYIKDPLSKKPYLGQVWPGESVFPDFMHPNSSEFWEKELKYFFDDVPYDGVWIDMNEVANFCPGQQCQVDGTKECPSKEFPWQCCLSCSPFVPQDTIEFPPFSINNGGSRDALWAKSLPMRALHGNGEIEYNVHNLYGIAQSIKTYNAMKKIIRKRPWVLSRSTFPGSGKYVAKWTGDVSSDWRDMRYSITGMLSMGIFGIPMVGADICGFFGDASEELCARWIALGAWYPFSRNHNGFGYAPQELYRWDSVKRIGKKVLDMRYRLLPFWYTQMYLAHKTGVMVARPLFFEFPGDVECRSSDAMNRQFMVGRAILVSPVLEEGARDVRAYFPPGKWYNLFDSTSLKSTGEYLLLPTPLESMQVHVREGCIIPLQQPRLTTGEVKKTPFDLLVTLPESLSSYRYSDELFIDDGEEMEVGRQATVITYSLSNGRLESHVLQDKYTSFRQDGLKLKTITILGFRPGPSQVAPVVEFRAFSKEMKRKIKFKLSYSPCHQQIKIEVLSKVYVNEAIVVTWK